MISSQTKERNMRTLILTLGIFVLSVPLGWAQESPVRAPAGARNDGSIAVASASAETSVQLVNDFGLSWVLNRQGDGSYEGVLQDPGNGAVWRVLGRISPSDFELHGVNPSTGPGFCGSFTWEGTRSGTTLTGRLFHEATAYNASVGCVTDTGVNGSLTILIP
jgi:hypothetical protein